MYAFAAFDPIKSWDPLGLESGVNLAASTRDFVLAVDELMINVADANTGLGASSSVRQRGATIGSLEKITQGANDIWKPQRSAAGHRLTEIADQNTTWTIEHDALGRVTAAIDQSFEYDPLGRLVLARDTNDVILESYLMDGDGRVVQVNRHTTNTAYETTVMAYEGAQMVSAWTKGAGGSWNHDWQAVWG